MHFDFFLVLFDHDLKLSWLSLFSNFIVISVLRIFLQVVKETEGVLKLFDEALNLLFLFDVFTKCFVPLAEVF